MKKKPNSAASRPLKHALHPFLALVLISGLISVFVYVRGRAQTNPQQQTSDTTGDRVLIQSNSSRIITSSPESLNAQTESSLGAFLEKHPGTWRIYVENGYTKVLRPVSSVSINTAPRDFSSQLLNEFSEIFGIGSAEISYVTDYNLGERHVVEYRQVIAGIPVEYSHITFSINGPGLEQISSRVYPEAKREIVGTSAAVDEQTAIKVINDDIASEAVKTQDLNLSYRASLSILSEQSSTTLTWKVIVTAKGALFSFTYYVDAASGRIVKKYSNVKSQKQAEQSQDSGESIHQASAVLNRENAATTIPGVEKNGASVMQESRSQDTFAAGWQHILSENFDTLEFPYSPWAVFDNNGSTGGQLFWDDQNCIFNDPSWSLWAADGGANRLNACTDNYANNMNSWVVYGPFSLADASDGLFDFHYRNDSEANFDYFNWLASVDGTTFHGFRVSGSSNGWRYQSLDFKNIPTLGNIVGRPQVWIAFVFTSDSTVISGKGPFVDDVAIKKFVNMSCTGVSGHVGGHIYGRNKNELQLSNFKNMKVVLDRSFAFDSHTVTDASGNYSSSECSDSIRFELEGFGSRNYVKVKDCNNGVCNPGDVLQSASLPFTSQVNFDWNEDAEDKKEVNVFWHLNEIHDWFKALIGQDLMNYQLPAQVDYLDGQSCNNGDVNAFYNPGDAGIYFCPSDVSRESDVIYHEYTHGVIDHIANYTLPYQDESGAINEGVADYYAAVKNNDATIGEGVGVIRRITDVVNFSDKCNRESGSGCRNDQYWLRSTSPARGNDYGYVHHNSLVPSGALWNLRQSQGLSQSYVDKLVIDTLIFHRPLNFTQLLNGLIAQDGGARESQIRAAFATRGVGNALPTLTSSLVISPSGPYMAGQTITGSFSITNRGSSAITLDVLTIGGRLNSDSTVRDFPWLTNVTLNPNQTRTYQSTFLLSEAGNYRFFPAYRTGGIWKIGLLGEIAKDPGVIDLVSFTVNPTCSGPGAFSLSSPGNGQSVTSTTSVNLTWQASANASSYDVFFGTSFNPQFLANQTGTSRTVSVTPGQTYWWKVVAKVNCNSSLTNATPVWSFTVQPSCNAPGAFSLSAPGNSQSLSSTTSVNLTWQASANASSYDVFFGTSSNPQFLANQTGTSRTVNVTPGQTYWWKVVAKVNCNSSLTTAAGVWSFSVQTVSPGSVIQFGNPSYAVAENGTIGTVTITRFGDVSGTATVNYATSDAAGLNNCSIISGNASSRCDYSFLTGTLSFGPGETFKAISIPIVDDTYAEGNEMFSISLSNPVGPTLGAPNVATVIINDNETFPGANPISNAPFFVRQHYRDFLNREPDSAGLSFWTNEIASCGSNQQCLELKQTNASAAFFLSIEFQETGYLAYRMYKAAFGDTTSPNVAIPVPIVRFNEFLPDAQRIGQGVQVGIGGWQTHLENNKRAYALEFVQRPQFISAYPLSLTSAQFVDRLNQNAGGVLSATERDQLIAELNAAGDVTQKRASVFRKVAEDADLRHRETNRAFVLMQYYGYLRRNPNDPQDFDFRGWEFWLNKLNQFNGNFVQAEMVKAFIVSAEYRQRFGP